MFKSALIGVRCLCVLLGLTLAFAPQVMRPFEAAAQAPGLTKAVCNISTGGTCAATTSATTGNVVQYNLTYSYTGTTAPATLTITDTLQAGQTFTGACFPLTAPAGTTFSCSSSGTSPPTITITIGNASTGATGTVAIQTQVTGTVGSISNQGSITATVSACPPGYTFSPGPPPVCTSGASTLAPSCPTGYTGPTGSGTCVSPVAMSNTTTVTVGTAPPPATCLSASKTVRNINQGDFFTTNDFAFPGDQLQYRVIVTNSCAATAMNVTVSDTIQPGQTFSPAPNCNPGCTMGVNTVTFPLGSLPSGASATVYFSVFVSPNVGGAVLPNTATVTSSNAATATTNTTSVQVVALAAPPPVFVPPPFVGIPFTSTILVCGVLTAFTPSGVMTIGGETFTLMPGLVAGGVPFTLGGNFCVTLTFNGNALITAVVFSVNVTAINFVCGVVTPFTIGAGTVMIGGFPFAVAPGTVFPFTPVVGNTFCFLMNGGFINGSLSVVPTAATPATAAAGIHHAGRSLAL